MYPFADGEVRAHLVVDVPGDHRRPRPPTLGIGDLPGELDTVVQGRAGNDLALGRGRRSLTPTCANTSPPALPGSRPTRTSRSRRTTWPGRVRALNAEASTSDLHLCGGAQVAGELARRDRRAGRQDVPGHAGAGMPMPAAGLPVTEFTPEVVRAFGGGGAVAAVQQEALNGRRAYPGGMDSERPVCPACGQPVDTVVRRHKTLGAWVPLWVNGPCRNPQCEKHPGREARAGGDGGTVPVAESADGSAPAREDGGGETPGAR